MSEPKFKLGDDGELEEIIDDFDEKPKRKRKPYNRTLYIPMSLMLVLLVSVFLLGLITYWVKFPSPQSRVVVYPTQLRPSETPGGYLDQVPPCGLLPVTEKPRFAFSVSSLDSDSELLRIDTDGTNKCRLTNNNTNDNHPSWSPDGKRIAFVANFAAAGYEYEEALYLMDANGENLFTLAKGFTAVSSPSWSPDSKRIVFHGATDPHAISDIYVINRDGTNLINLTNNPSRDFEPDWSLDGQSIVFASDRTAKPDDISVFDKYEIYVMDTNGGNVRQITSNRDMDTSPKWSPDSQWIVFEKQFNVYLMDKDGNHVRQLTDIHTGTDLPFWASSNEIGFTTNDKLIHFMNIYSGQTRLFSVTGIVSEVAPWSPPAEPFHPNV